MNGYRMLFEDLKVGRTFEKNGNLWVKKSTRTASIIEPAEYSGRWFYFKNHDLVTIGIDSAFISVRDELFQADADIQKTLSKILTDEA
jgi:hypothetical protein